MINPLQSSSASTKLQPVPQSMSYSWADRSCVIVRLEPGNTHTYTKATFDWILNENTVKYSFCSLEILFLLLILSHSYWCLYTRMHSMFDPLCSAALHWLTFREACHLFSSVQLTPHVVAHFWICIRCWIITLFSPVCIQISLPGLYDYNESISDYSSQSQRIFCQLHFLSSPSLLSLINLLKSFVCHLFGSIVSSREPNWRMWFNSMCWNERMHFLCR